MLRNFSGSNNLDISSLTTGISKEGLAKYIEDLAMCITICGEIDNVDEVIQAINNCWQGESRDRFLEAFAEIQKNIKDAIRTEYANLQSNLEELFNGMIEVDKYGIYDYK